MKGSAFFEKWNSMVSVSFGRLAVLFGIVGIIAFAVSAAAFGSRDGIPEDIEKDGSFTVQAAAVYDDDRPGATSENSVMMWRSTVLADSKAKKAKAEAEANEKAKAEKAAAVSAAAEQAFAGKGTELAASAVVTAAAKKDVIAYSAQEFDMMCSVVMSEVGYMSEDFKLAVANVIINRVKSEKFPDTVYEVLHQENQFNAIENYYTRRLVPDDEVIDCVRRALAGEGAELIKGATFYYAPSLSSERAIQFFEKLDYRATVGNARFFRAWDDTTR